MKRIAWLASAWLALLASNAQATMNMQDREHAQTIVWIVEAASFIVIVAIGWFVWRISTRAANNRKPKQEA